MPLEFEPKEVIPANEIVVRRNTDMIAGMQASESYSVRAGNNHVLGATGETSAFGKYNFDVKTAPDTLARDFANSSGPLFNNDKLDYVNNAKHGGDRNLLTRAVASSQLDKQLGLNILAEEKFGMDGQEKLLGISVQVDGAGMTGKFTTQENGVEVEAHAFLGITPADVGLNPSAALQNSGLPQHLQGYADPRIQKGLSDLEVMDYVSGQIDRHPGNVFINPQTGQVKGIDNDLAFPEVDRNELLRDVALRQKMVPTIPMKIHQDTARKLAAVDPEAMRQTLENVTRPDGKRGLSPQEIQGAVNRLQELQQVIANPASVPGFQVVAQFDDHTFLEAIDQQKETYQNQQDAMARKYGNPVGEKTFDNIGSKDFEDAYRSSYTGSLLMAEKQKTVEIAARPNGNTIRPANTVTTARRNEQFVEFAAQMEVAKDTFKANPSLIADQQLGQQVSGLQKEIADAREKISHYNKETAKLDNHKLGALVRSLASGGVDGRKEFYAQKKDDATNRLEALEKQLDQALKQAIPDALKADIYADAELVVAARQPVVAQNNALQPPVAVQPNPALAGMVPNHPAPPPPGQFNHPPPSDMAPAVPNQDNLAQGNDQPKAAKTKIAAKNKEGDLTVKAAEDELEVSDPDDLDADVEVEVEVKKEGLAKVPSVAEMLKRTNSAPQLGGHKAAQGIGGEEPKPASNSLRASGSWQAAKPSGPKPGGNSLTSSHL